MPRHCQSNGFPLHLTPIPVDEEGCSSSPLCHSSSRPHNRLPPAVAVPLGSQIPPFPNVLLGHKEILLVPEQPQSPQPPPAEAPQGRGCRWRSPGRQREMPGLTASQLSAPGRP